MIGYLDSNTSFSIMVDLMKLKVIAQQSVYLPPSKCVRDRRYPTNLSSSNQTEVESIWHPCYKIGSKNQGIQHDPTPRL